MIFDLDGTLVNAYPAVTQSVNFTLEKLGFPPKSADQIKRAVGWGDRHLMAQFVGEDLADKALKIYRPHHLKALGNGVRFLPGARSLIPWCKHRRILLAIASNRPIIFTRAILQGLGVEKDFDVVLCADQAQRPKPYPDMLLDICRRLKIKKEQTLFVGDMTLDVVCGARSKIKTVAVATGSNTKKELKESKPYKIINHISQLRMLIDPTS
ncbi:MAG: HAD family hydrolase [Candidatus Omnitrophica bacterium]|nr:HAD family hydrolase [Candidatus Omnitrophota bacterium]